MSSTIALKGLLPLAEPAQTPPGEGDGVLPLRLSFSRVDTYQSCPLRFRFAYVDELPSVPGPQLSWGSSIHSALETWWSAKLPEPPGVEVLLQALYDHWDDEGFEGMEREEKLKWYRHAQDILRRHHARFAPTYVPAIATEQWFEIDLGDAITVVGSIDHVEPIGEGRFGIVDWKTNKKAKTRAQVSGSLQLAIYALAAKELWGAEPEWVALDFVVPGLRVSVDRRDIDTESTVRRIHEVARQIRAESFAPKPSGLCPWCDWRSQCPAFQGEGPDVAGTAVVELRKLKRRQQRDAERIAALEDLVRDRLGPEAVLDVG